LGNFEKAITYYKRCKETIDVCKRIAYIYELGLQLINDKSDESKKKPDYEKAIEYLNKIYTKHNDLEANLKLAELFEKGGNGIQKDNKKAIDLYTKYYEKTNDVEVCHKIAVIYELDDKLTDNFEMAAKYYHLAADENHVESSLKTGKNYLKGFKFKQSHENAQRYFKIAAEGGDLGKFY
jgi:uncharacterized protein